MIVYRISKCKFIDSLNSMGAATFGGRWNSKGIHVIYTAATPSLALMESVVHIFNIPVDDYCMAFIEIPEDKIAEIKLADLPANWFINPARDTLKSIGDRFIKNNIFLALKLPSAIMTEDFNFLLNPNHADFKKVKIISTRTIPIDERLFKK